MAASEPIPPALNRWLARNVPGFDEVASMEKFAGGQSNPTYCLRDTRGRPYVLRRQPFGTLLPSAHAVDREFRLLSALHPRGFPVPRPIALCTDTRVLGSIFYVMERVVGRNFWDARLPDLAPSDRRAIYQAMITALGQLHAIDAATAGLEDFGRPGNYFARQLSRWTKQYRAAQTDDVPEIDRLIEWLPTTMPEQSATAIIHGDYRIDNLIFTPDSPRVSAVLDWELATLGDPLADFTYLAMHWVMPIDGRSGLLGADFKAEGLPSLTEAVELYCQTTGRTELPNLHWYFAYNLFRLTCIVQGVKRRAIDGNASNAMAAETAKLLEPYGRLAWRQAELAGA